jgi:hypothetical protein
LRYGPHGVDVVAVADINGNPVPQALEEAKQRGVGYESHYDNAYMTGESAASVGIDLSEENLRGRAAWYRMEDSLLNEITAPEGEIQYWYYLPREGYAVGYRAEQRTIVDYVGPAGFTTPAEAPPPKRFEGTLLRNWTGPFPRSGEIELALTHGVYGINHRGRKVTETVAASPPERILNVVHVSRQPRSVPNGEIGGGEPMFTVIATTAKLAIRLPDDKTLFTTPLEHGPKDGYESATIAGDLNEKRFYLWYRPRAADLPHRVVELSNAGEVLSRREFPQIKPTFDGGRWPGAERWIEYFVSPPVLLVYLMMRAWLYWGAGVSDWVRWPAERVRITITLTIAIASAAASFLIARRQNQSRATQIAWAVVNFFVGPAGVVTRALLPKWPLRERCPMCGALRPITSDRCPKCEAPFAAPAPDGTEIYAA